MGLLPCTCSCWNGPKAPKISTLTTQVRANAAPYMTNTTHATSGSARSCIQCKIKMDQEQHQHLQMRQQQLNNCSHQQHSHQQHHHCHCSANHVNPNLNMPPIMTFPVPPPPLSTTVPTFLPTTPQASTSALMSANNQMYFVPFNVPNIMTGTAPPITTNPMTSSTSNICPHHPQLQPTTANKNYSAKARSVPSLRSTAAAAVSSRRESDSNNDDTTNDSKEQESSTPFEIDDEDDEEDERNSNENFKIMLEHN